MLAASEKLESNTIVPYETRAHNHEHSSQEQSFGGKLSRWGSWIHPEWRLATGGLALMGMGILMAGFRSAIQHLRRWVVTTAEFDSRDEAYAWIVTWLSVQPYTQRTTFFGVWTSLARFGHKGSSLVHPSAGSSTSSATCSSNVTSTTTQQQSSSAIVPSFFFLPAQGDHIFFHKGKLLFLSRSAVKSGGGGGSGGSSNSMPVEIISVSVLGRSRAAIHDLVLEARSKYMELDEARTVIFSADQYGAWRRTRSRPVRPLSTIVLQNDIKQRILDDARDFLASEQWYSERGIPHRRGYLLHGPPGTGKTSFITALAGELKLNIYVINLSQRTLTDELLLELMIDTPSRCIVLLEDIDAAGLTRAGNSTSAVTFSGLLNAIDGVAASEGRLLFLTTNHLETLDPALIRPGRVDMSEYFGLASRSMISELFMRFYPQHAWEGCDHRALAESFAALCPDNAISMASVQGFLMTNKSSPKQAVDLVGAWLASLNTPSSSTFSQPSSISSSSSPDIVKETTTNS